ncbi:MAG: CHAD domain-containing protein [Lacunisphaera sp.]|nr:CHAD domain-containing protein [Lacunisphaera sp.]
MKLRLPLNRSIGAWLVALGAGLTREAAEQLAGLATAPVESVHRARVALKRARSTLRLLEKAGADWASMTRYRLTQLAGLMSAAREAAVAPALADVLSRRLPGPEREVARLLAGKKGRLVPSDAEQIRQALLQEARDLAIAPAPVILPAQLRDLLRRSLDRATRRYYEAAVKPTLVSVHEWRKAVIILRDQTALAAARWPRGAGVAHPLLVRFARQLGHRGDLALLERRLQHLQVPPTLQRARRTLPTRLEIQREQATLTAMLRWLRLEPQQTRLLSGKTRSRRTAELGR